MKRFILLAVLSGVLISPNYANKLINIPTQVKQPDGTSISCLASGDEFFNYLHDKNGFTIIQNPDDGFYYYGVRQGDEIIPSQYKVNSVNPASVGLIAGAKISFKLYQQRRNAFLAPMKTKGMTDAPTSGQVNQIAIYISFADDSIYSTPRQEYFADYHSMEQRSLKHYYNEVSYNRLFIDTYHYPISPDTINVSYVSEHPRSYFVPYSASNPTGYTDGQKTGREHTLLKKAVEAIADQIPDTLNLDANNDGNIDNVCFIIKGGTTAWSSLLWPHRWSLYTTDARIGTKRVRDYLLMLEATFDVGTLCHEFFHVLGAPDLYHYTESYDANDNAMKACGPWDIMDQSSGHHYMGAFMKYKYGDWISTIPEITEAGTYTLYPLQNPEKNIYKISSPFHPTEYFILEYRKKEGIYESSLPGEGLIVSRINPSAGNGNAGGPPDEIYIYRPGGTINMNGSVSSAAIGNSSNSISDGTNPSSFLYNNGKGGKGGLNITDVTMFGDSITFVANIQALQAPIDLSFTMSSGGVDLDWLSLFTDDFQNYTVYKNGEVLQTTTSSQFSDSEIEEGVSYSYYVTANYSGNLNGESEASNTIRFTPKGIQSLPYTEDFEAETHGWTILGSVNGFRRGNTELHQMTSNNETYYLGANSFLPGHSANAKDMAISPRLDLSTHQSANITFDYTLKRLSSGEFLRIWIRKSATDNWIEITKLGVSGFGPNYVWRTMKIDLPNEAFSSSSQIGFQYNDQGELSYSTGFDNFSIQGVMTGIENSSLETSFSVYPNPSHGKFSITLLGGIQNETNLRVLDITGRTVFEKILKETSLDKRATIDLNMCQDGIYVLILSNQKQTFTKKLIKH